MKLINDDGEIVEEFDDDSTVVIFTDNDVQFVIKKMDDNDVVPPHVVTATAIVTFGCSDEGSQVVRDWFEKQTDAASDK